MLTLFGSRHLCGQLHSGVGHQPDITARNFEWADSIASWACDHAEELAALDAQFRAQAKRFETFPDAVVEGSGNA